MISWNEEPLHPEPVEGITPEMAAKTKAKLDDWQEFVDSNPLDSEDQVKIDKYYTGLRDPSLYALTFFKNQDGSPFRVYPYQDIILNDRSERVLFAAANQIGKSICLCIKGLHFAILNPGTTTLMSSKTLPQSKDLLRQIKDFLRNSSVDFEVGDTETKTEIYFRHYEDTGNEEFKELKQSRIICAPATEGALGYAVHLALPDELGFYDDGVHFYNQILQPRTYFTKGQIMAFSNPNGQQGILWDLWNDSWFSKYRFNYLDCPVNTQARFDKIAKRLTQERIDSTMMAVFTNPEGGFFTVEQRKAMQEDRESHLPLLVDTPLFIFFDFAKTIDRTVRCIGIPVIKGEEMGVKVLEMLEYPQGKDYTEIVEELDLLINERGQHNIAMVGWDNTGVGRGIEGFISKVSSLGVVVNPVEFSLENKSAIYINFKLLVEKNLREGELGVKIPLIPECDKQLAKLRFKRSSRGHLMVHHERESDRDDFPDAIAGLCSLIVDPTGYQVSIEVIGGDSTSSANSSDQCECGSWLDCWEETCGNCGKDLIGDNYMF